MSLSAHSEPALVLDPAMLAEEDDSEYEYEYDQVDTEVLIALHSFPRLDHLDRSLALSLTHLKIAPFRLST